MPTRHAWMKNNLGFPKRSSLSLKYETIFSTDIVSSYTPQIPELFNEKCLKNSILFCLFHMQPETPQLAASCGFYRLAASC